MEGRIPKAETSVCKDLVEMTEELQRLFDILFEACSPEFSIRIQEAIKKGPDLSRVADEIRLWILRNELHCDKWPAVKAAIEGTASLLERQLQGDSPTKEEWSAAWSNAKYAGESAMFATRYASRKYAISTPRYESRHAAKYAAYSAAESTVWATAMLAAKHAAWSAADESANRHAAMSAAMSAVYERIALVLLDKVYDT